MGLLSLSAIGSIPSGGSKNFCGECIFLLTPEGDSHILPRMFTQTALQCLTSTQLCWHSQYSSLSLL